VLKGLRISPKWSRGRSVSIVFRKWAGKPRDSIWISGTGKKFFLFYINSRHPLEPTKLPGQLLMGSVSWGVKHTARETDHIYSAYCQDFFFWGGCSNDTTCSLELGGLPSGGGVV
jgi:hypothetical protein